MSKTAKDTKKINIEWLTLDEITPYEQNPRNNKKAVKAVAKSIEKYGFKVPLVIDKDGVIVCGHTRYKAAEKLGLEELPCVRADDLTEEEIRQFRIIDNKTSELSEWDFPLLKMECEASNLTSEEWGFDFLPENFDENLASGYDDHVAGNLKKKFIMPPYSVLDARQGDWQKRKRTWLSFVDSGDGRSDILLSDGLLKLAQKSKRNVTGTSIFDPVLCEIMYHWFSAKGDKILDPFAGGSVRGVVAQMLERSYTGNDLRPEQIEANENGFARMAEAGIKTVYGNELSSPRWTCGDSLHIDEIVKEKDFDMLFTCPPYVDLEQYSDNEADISNMDYPEFMATFTEIIRKACDKLKDNSFAVCVIGNVRDDKGVFYDFETDTIKAFQAAGLKYYNEIILITMGGTLALRAGKTFAAGRKVGNTHQKVLAFIKGDPKAKISEAFNETKDVAELHKKILVFAKGKTKNKDGLGELDYDF